MAKRRVSTLRAPRSSSAILGRLLARVLAVSARTRVIAREFDDALRLAEDANAMAAALGLAELQAHTLTTRALAKEEGDSASAQVDFARALEIARAVDSPVASVILNNFARHTSMVGGDLALTAELYLEAASIAERFGDGQSLRFVRGNLLWIDFQRGHWDPVADAADCFIAECEGGAPHAMETVVRALRGSIREARGDLDGALSDRLLALKLARERQDPQSIIVALALTSATRFERGELEDARRLAEELLPLVGAHGLLGPVWVVAPIADALGVGDELREIAENARGIPFTRATRCALAGDFVGSAAVFAEIGSLTFEATSRFHAGRRYLALGERAEGEAQLLAALEFHRSVGATFYIGRAEALLSATQSESA